MLCTITMIILSTFMTPLKMTTIMIMTFILSMFMMTLKMTTITITTIMITTRHLMVISMADTDMNTER